MWTVGSGRASARVLPVAARVLGRVLGRGWAGVARRVSAGGLGVYLWGVLLGGVLRFLAGSGG